MKLNHRHRDCANGDWVLVQCEFLKDGSLATFERVCRAHEPQALSVAKGRYVDYLRYLDPKSGRRVFALGRINALGSIDSDSVVRYIHGGV